MEGVRGMEGFEGCAPSICAPSTFRTFLFVIKHKPCYFLPTVSKAVFMEAPLNIVLKGALQMSIRLDWIN